MHEMKKNHTTISHRNCNEHNGAQLMNLCTNQLSNAKMPTFQNPRAVTSTALPDNTAPRMSRFYHNITSNYGAAS
jgi:hypothetical protein